MIKCLGSFSFLTKWLDTKGFDTLAEKDKFHCSEISFIVEKSRNNLYNVKKQREERFISMGFFDIFRKKVITQPDKPASSTMKIPTEEYLNDITYIKEMVHIVAGPWHQYDVLLASCGYGWDTMKDWADYMSAADLEDISQVTTGLLGTKEEDITKSYSDNGGKCENTPELNNEMGVLSIAGMSKTLQAPMKIVWINQTHMLRFFTFIDDELLMKKYVETTVRRTFGTEKTMKLGKPISKRKWPL